jgi:hypothetical protein
MFKEQCKQVQTQLRLRSQLKIKMLLQLLQTLEPRRPKQEVISQPVTMQQEQEMQRQLLLLLSQINKLLITLTSTEMQ